MRQMPGFRGHRHHDFLHARVQPIEGKLRKNGAITTTFGHDAKAQEGRDGQKTELMRLQPCPNAPDSRNLR